MEANPVGFGSVRSFCVRAGVSRSHFYRSFSAEVGTPPGEFRSRLVVDRAVQLLAEEPRLPLEVVAMRAGFANAPAMIKAFRRRMGVTPGRWRDGRTSESEDGP